MIGQIVDSATEPLQKEKAPNSIPSLVLGGIALCFCTIAAIYSWYPILCITAIVMGIVGLILSLIGKKKTAEGYEMYYANPEKYFGVGMLKAGKIMSLVALIVSGISILTGIIMTIVYSVLMD